MDWQTLSNYMIFILAFVMDVMAVDTTDTSTETPAEDPYALFNEGDYTNIFDGDDTDETEAFATNSIAWFAFGGADTLTGSAGDDFGAMGDGHDSASMGDGDDIVYGDAGADTLFGGLGDDLLLGGADMDRLEGGGGDDGMTGDAGDDVLEGGIGADTILGGDGDDVLSGFDSFGGGSDTMTAADGADVLSGGAGNDTIMMGHGDTATGGEDADQFTFDARYDDGTAAMTITDFDPDSDALQLLYTPTLDSNGVEIAPELTVAPDEAGENALVSLNGEVVAVINGQPDLSADAITLTADTAAPGTNT